jgi:hypothetical protein
VRSPEGIPNILSLRHFTRSSAVARHPGQKIAENDAVRNATPRWLKAGSVDSQKIFDMVKLFVSKFINHNGLIPALKQTVEDYSEK